MNDTRSQTPIFQRLDLTANLPYGFKEYIARFAWNLAWMLLIRHSPKRAHRWRGRVLNWFGADTTPGTVTKKTTRIFHPWLFRMGKHSALAEGVTVYNLGPITIGDHTVISQDVYLCAGTHDYTKPNLPLQRPPINIGSGVWICAKAFIGPGVTIGDNSVVGACAVVTRDVPPGVVVAGNPAKIVKNRPMVVDNVSQDTQDSPQGN